ncbi:hypothetical protein GCM10027592_07690 [Spirosoma flavus]
MTHTITIETQSDHDFALLKGLAQRLGLSTREAHYNSDPSEAELQAALKKFAGSWQGEETADELEARIYSARNDQPRDIEL